jgi:hypothetical protein
MKNLTIREPRTRLYLFLNQGHCKHELNCLRILMLDSTETGAKQKNFTTKIIEIVQH